MKLKLSLAILLIVPTAAFAVDVHCSTTACLINTLVLANLTPASDTITLDAGRTYQLESTHNSVLQPVGLPTITTPIVIRGNGAILRRNPVLECEPLFGQHSFGLIAVAQGGHLIIENLSLRFGCGREGGAVRSNRGRVELYGVSVLDNVAFGGAGVYSQDGVLIARSARFQFNRVIDDTGRGGAIHVMGGEAQLNLCDLLDNEAAQGGALGVSGAAVVTYNGAARFNNAVQGGAIIALDSQLTLDGARVMNNSASFVGGGVSSDRTLLEISNTRIQDNVAGRDGGGLNIHSGKVAGLWSTIRSSSIIRNHAGLDGGGLSASAESGALLVIVNTTFAENSADGAGGGLRAAGGANLFVFHSTLARNDSMSGSSVANTSPIARTELSGSILGAPRVAGQPICFTDLAAGAARPISSGHNIGEDGTCNLTHPRDRARVSAGLLPPRDTGRPGGWHFPLGISSIARDAGNFTACGGLPELRFDQLGGLRSDLMCDIGSIEYSPPHL